MYGLLWTISRTTVTIQSCLLYLTNRRRRLWDRYNHAQMVFNQFNMTDLGGYHSFFLLTDVLLLADVSENFRDMWLQHYGLDLAQNYTFPVLSWQAALKMTKVELDLLIDINQHLFIKEGIRRGVAMISQWYNWTNVPDMENYDASKCNSYIMYFDTNNLYR